MLDYRQLKQYELNCFRIPIFWHLDALIEVYNSYIGKCIDDYNIGFYYCTPECIYESYKAGEMID